MIEEALNEIDETPWQHLYPYNLVCQASETAEVQSNLVSQSLSLEVSSGLVLQLQKKLQQEHNNLQFLARQLTATKTTFLAPNPTRLHLTASQLETSVKKDIENLQNGSEFCEHFVKELNKFKVEAETLIPQMKYLLCQLSQHQDFLNYTMRRQTDLFLMTDLAGHPLLESYRRKRKLYKKRSMRQKSSRKR